MIRENPCLSCGACCAFFRVSFYWVETTDAAEGIIPAHLTEDLTPFVRAMKGSNQSNPRCIALDGKIGSSVCCSIYNQRPSTCHDFGLEFSDGLVTISPEDYERCTHARAHFSLPPVTVNTFRAIQTTSPQPFNWPVKSQRKRRKNRSTSQPPSGQNPTFTPPV